MKKNLSYLLLTLFVLGSAAFTVRVLSILEQLKIAEQEAKEYILSDFADGTLQFPYSEALKALATNKRADAVKQIGEYIRKYTESAEFQKEFQAIRESMTSGPAKKTKDQLLQEKIESLKHDVKTTEEDMKSAPASMKKLYEETLKQQRENLAALENPAHPKHKMYLADLLDFYEEDYKQSNAGQDASSNNFPETPRQLVKQRLQEFLAFTADIDFDAKLVPAGRVKKFADPNLEAKSAEWKRCFRAGKETITAARAFAQSWLASIK